MNKVLFSSKNMCWCTPSDFFKKLDNEFHFALDAAATEKTTKCSKFFTPETDGLAHSWLAGGAVFCNPPYGREIGRWVKKPTTNQNKCHIPLFYLSQRGRTHRIFMISFTTKQKYVLCVGD